MPRTIDQILDDLRAMDAKRNAPPPDEALLCKEAIENATRLRALVVEAGRLLAERALRYDDEGFKECTSCGAHADPYATLQHAEGCALREVLDRIAEEQ